MDKFDIVVAAVVLLIVERLDRNAILVLEQRIEQRAVRIAARVAHDINLERCGIYEREQPAVVVRLQIADGFDVLQIVIVIQLGNLLVVVVQLIPVAEDNRIFIVIQLPVDMVDLEVRAFRNVQIGRTRVVEVQKQNLIREQETAGNIAFIVIDLFNMFRKIQCILFILVSDGIFVQIDI